MLNKNNLVLFIALSVGLWLGTSFQTGEDASPYLEELLKPNHIIAGLVGGAVGTIVSHLFKKMKKDKPPS